MDREDNDILDIETNDRDVDRTAKKLRSLDKLMQQTQRRATLFGKTRIKPILTLDDRLTSAARKAEEVLTRLHRTTSKPVVQMSDRVSATALKLQDSLAALAAAPWQLTAAGVDWEAVVGDSFTGWVSSEGKSTLKRISAAIGDALVFTGKVASSLLAPESKGLAKNDNPLSAQPEKKGPLEKTAESFFGFTKDVRKDVSKDYAKEGTKELLDQLFSIEKDKKVECKCQVTCNCNCGSGGGYIGGTGSGRKGRGRGAKGTRPNRRGRLNLPKNTGLPSVDLPKPSSGRAIKGSLKKIGVGMLLNTGIDMLGGGGIPDLITKGAGSVDKYGAKLLGKAGGLIGKIGKGIKLPGPLGLIADASAIATASNNKDRVKATTSAVASSIGGLVGGALGSVIPVAGTAIGATLGSMAGDFVGNRLGGVVYNLFSKKKETAEKKTPPKSSSSLPVTSTTGLTADPQLAPSLAGINPYAGNVNREKDDAKNQTSASPQVNVSLSPGALSLTVNKDEVNYDELAKAAGWKIANEVRFAMQNLK